MTSSAGVYRQATSLDVVCRRGCGEPAANQLLLFDSAGCSVKNIIWRSKVTRDKAEASCCTMHLPMYCTTVSEQVSMFRSGRHDATCYELSKAYTLHDVLAGATER